MPPSPASFGFRGAFRDDLPARAVYSEAAGIARVLPRAVCVPLDADDAAMLVRWAAETNVPLVPRGSGSSMAGGAIGDGVIVDLSRLDDVQAPNAASRTIRCGPGAVRDAVDAAARAAGLQFPVDPSSGAFCSVGGMVSTNAAGAHTLRYGSTRPWVEALDCVFADGSRAELRRGVPAPRTGLVARALDALAPVIAEERTSPSLHAGVRKESSGYGLAAFVESADLVDLIAGSEGTLALVVGLELRLAPVRPHTASVLGAFATLEAAVAGADGARRMGAVACEALDRTFLDVARRGGAPRADAGGRRVRAARRGGGEHPGGGEGHRASDRVGVPIRRCDGDHARTRRRRPSARSGRFATRPARSSTVSIPRSRRCS